MVRHINKLLLDQYKEDAKLLGVTLSEYLSFLILLKLDELKVEVFPFVE